MNSNFDVMKPFTVADWEINENPDELNWIVFKGTNGQPSYRVNTQTRQICQIGQENSEFRLSVWEEIGMLEVTKEIFEQKVKDSNQTFSNSWRFEVEEKLRNYVHFQCENQSYWMHIRSHRILNDQELPVAVDRIDASFIAWMSNKADAEYKNRQKSIETSNLHPLKEEGDYIYFGENYRINFKTNQCECLTASSNWIKKDFPYIDIVEPGLARHMLEKANQKRKNEKLPDHNWIQSVNECSPQSISFRCENQDPICVFPMTGTILQWKHATKDDQKKVVLGGFVSIKETDLPEPLKAPIAEIFAKAKQPTQQINWAISNEEDFTSYTNNQGTTYRIYKNNPDVITYRNFSLPAWISEKRETLKMMDPQLFTQIEPAAEEKNAQIEPSQEQQPATTPPVVDNKQASTPEKIVETKLAKTFENVTLLVANFFIATLVYIVKIRNELNGGKKFIASFAVFLSTAVLSTLALVEWVGRMSFLLFIIPVAVCKKPKRLYDFSVKHLYPAPASLLTIGKVSIKAIFLRT